MKFFENAVLIVIVVLLGGMTTAFANTDFEQIKSLVGEWEGHGAAAGVFTVEYRLISDGTAVMETIQAGEHPGGMTTIYYMDGDNVMMTHLCAKNNQPRMKSVQSQEEGTLTFDFVDATNLPDPDEGHMVRLAFHWQDVNRFAQEWTYRESGQDQQLVFPLTRKVRQVSVQPDLPCVQRLPLTRSVDRPNLVQWSASSGVDRWEAECSRLLDHGRIAMTPEKSQCTCARCECK